MLREIFVVKTALLHFLNEHPTFTGDITCTLDNIGAVCALLSGKVHCLRTAQLISEILEFSRPEGPVLYFNWNRRNEPGIELTDFASKNYPISLTQAGWERIRKNFPKNTQRDPFRTHRPPLFGLRNYSSHKNCQKKPSHTRKIFCNNLPPRYLQNASDHHSHNVEERKV